MDYRIFNVHTWSFWWVRMYTGVGHTNRVSTTFLTWKNYHKYFWCSWRRWGSNLRSLDLESDALPTEPPRFPMLAHHHDLERYAKCLGSYLQGQGHSVGSNPQKITAWSSEPFATKLGALSWATVLCDNFGLLCSRSTSQWGFRSSGNILVVLTTSSKPLNLP